MTAMPQKTGYEELQGFNVFTRWLHSVRYKYILGVVGKYAASRPPGEVIRILDIGCGPAKLYELLDHRFAIDYHGCEIYQDFLMAAKERYGGRPNFRISSESITTGAVPLEGYDLIIALETLEHIPEHDVVRLVEGIAKARPKLFVCSVPIEIGPSIWLKNVGSWICGYPRHKEYTWAQTFWAGLCDLDRIPLHETSHIGFDWRWLAQTIRHNLRTVVLKKSPISWLPASVSSSVFIVAEPRR